MSMTRGEAIEELERLLSHWDDLENGKRCFRWYSKDAVEVALSALRPVSREKVEKAWRGEWEGVPRLGVYDMACSKCGYSPGIRFYSSDFCPNCGAPMTDEAVQMVIERLEALKDGSTTD